MNAGCAFPGTALPTLLSSVPLGNDLILTPSRMLVDLPKSISSNAKCPAFEEHFAFHKVLSRTLLHSVHQFLSFFSLPKLSFMAPCKEPFLSTSVGISNLLRERVPMKTSLLSSLKISQRFWLSQSSIFRSLLLGYLARVSCLPLLFTGATTCLLPRRRVLSRFNSSTLRGPQQTWPHRHWLLSVAPAPAAFHSLGACQNTQSWILPESMEPKCAFLSLRSIGLEYL